VFEKYLLAPYNNNCGYDSTSLPPRYPYLDVSMGFAWSKDPDSYAGGGIPTGRISHA
jgi:hypothetical protein